MNKIIVGALVVLILLIFFSLIITGFLTNRNQSQTLAPTPFPTSFLNRRGGVPVPLTADQQASQKIVQQQGKVYSDEQRNRVNEFIKKLPQSNDDFEIVYSDNLGRFYAQTKTPDGEQKLNDYLNQNNMSDIRTDYGYLFSITNRPVRAVIQNETDAQMNIRLEKATQSVENTQGKKKTQLQKDTSTLGDLSQTLFNFEVPTLPPQSQQSPAGKSQAPSGKGGPIGNPGSLDQIINEAGTKVGTPPKFLKAMMSIECGSLFSLSPDLIAQYSAPGGGLPPGHPCFRNSIGAMGPMQFMGNTWPQYANAVNVSGGYTHSPNVENIRDSLYAAAEKFKSDGQGDGVNWTFEQIRRAYGCYAGGCGAYDSGRLGQDFERLFATFLERYNSY